MYKSSKKAVFVYSTEILLDKYQEYVSQIQSYQ